MNNQIKPEFFLNLFIDLAPCLGDSGKRRKQKLTDIEEQEEKLKRKKLELQNVMDRKDEEQRQHILQEEARVAQRSSERKRKESAMLQQRIETEKKKQQLDEEQNLELAYQEYKKQLDELIKNAEQFMMNINCSDIKPKLLPIATNFNVNNNRLKR